MDEARGDLESPRQQPARANIRRSHKKSRNGCRYCKQRRIKCNEVKPTCSNCVRSAIPCEYPPYNQDSGPIVARSRGRPRKEWAVVVVGKHHDDTDLMGFSGTLPQTQSLITPGSDQSMDTPLHLPWCVEDLELFYHYMTAVPIGGQDNHLWRHQLPRLAFRRHSVLHLMLAVSALHLARHEPNRSMELVAQAEAHMSIGLRQATPALSNLCEENSAELYIVTILICTYTFAKQPGPRHLLVVSEGHEVAWWELFRGVRIVIERIGLPRILSLLAQDVGTEISAPLEHQGNTKADHQYVIFGPMEWESALNSISSIIEHAPTGREEVCQRTLNMLKWCFHDTFGTSAEPKPAADAKFETIMAWLYVLEDEYVDMLKVNEAVALVLLAHFAVLLQTLESVWFIKGWAIHILEGVSELLGDSPQAKWIQWPMMQVRIGARFVKEVQVARRGHNL